MYLPVWVLLLLLLGSAAADTFLLEAEQYVKDRVAYPRTTASGIWAVHFYQNEVFPIEFCVQSSTVIQVTNVRYSNDGGQDYVDVKLDDQQLGTFLSLYKSSSADEWNQFEDTGPIGGEVKVLAGRHRLDLAFVSTDRHGIEIDYLALHIADEAQDERLLKCASYCDDNLNYTPTLVSDSLPSGWLQQRSRRTTCAEERNVQIALYHPGLQSYRVTAQSPVYSTLLDSRQHDYHGCRGTERGHALWAFNHFPLHTSAQQITHNNNNAVLTFHGSNTGRNSRLTVTFSTSSLPDPPSSGAHLGLKLRRTSSSDAGLVHVLLVLNSSEPQIYEERSVDPSRNEDELSWELERDTLLKGDAELMLIVVHRPDVTLHVDYLRLEVTPPREVSSQVYRDTMTQIRAVTGADSGPQGMVLYRPDNRVSWHNVHAITVLKKLTWSEDFEEIFRLDRHGMVWLKPRSSYASDSPPYGTSLVVGPSDPDKPIPVAPISGVDIDPWALKFTLKYQDSSMSDVVVRSGSFGVRAIVTHRQWASTARAWPVAVVTSMWVADGKADVDHVSANGAKPREILSGWNRLFGTSFAFFRQCVSRHNTQAPDVLVDLLEPRPDLHVDLSGYTPT